MNMPAILDFMLNEQRRKTITCPECGGLGRVLWSSGRTTECPDCNGRGEIEQESEDE